MRKSSVKMTSLFILAAMLASLASCGSSSDSGNDTTAADTSDDTTAEVTTALTDEVPKLDFGGAEFRTIEQESTQNSFYQEEATGEVVSDAIYNRNAEMEERFNVKFTPTERQGYNEIGKLLEQSVLAGSDDYDLVFGQLFSTAALATKGILGDWNSVPYMDFDKPWYTKSIQDASVGDNLYMIESDLCIMYTEQTWLLVYNKTKAEEYPDFPDLYEVVNDGKWTIDYMDKLIVDLYRDLNGNTLRDEGDIFGYGGAQDGCQLAAFLYGCGARMVEIDSDLNLVQSIASEKAIDALTKLSTLFNVNEGSVHQTDPVQTSVHTRRALFCNGSVVFSPLQVQDLITEDLRSFEDDYGVLPLPKYDEDQEEYYTLVDGGANIMVFPSNASEDKREMLGAVTEAMSAATYNDITPKYCSLALEQKGARDDESMEMIRMILDSRVIDFGYLYDGFKGWTMKLPDMVKDAGSISSKIESNKNSVENYYLGVIEYCTEE